MKKIQLIILSLILFSFWSCQKDIDSPDPKSYDNEYFPLTLNHWVSYQIQDINIDIESAVNDTVYYQIKEVVESLTENLDDYKTFRLERYFRYTELDEWELLNVWQIRQYARRIHKIEENVEFIRLVTPAVEYEKWNGNTYNELDEEIYNIEKVEISQIGNQNIETVFVSQYDRSSLIDKHFSEEQYSKGIGLSNKTVINVELNIDPNLPWEEKITKGQIYYQNYIEHHD